MKQIVSFVLNGNAVEVAAPEHTLLEALRDGLGLTSPKCGCNHGDCGSCTVILDGQAVKSCLVLALTVGGKKVETLEGVTPREGLHPVQKAMHEMGAPQCGYCTPGMVMASVAYLRENPAPDIEEVKEALSGNICRCASYDKYANAVVAASRGEFGAMPEGGA